MSSTKNIRDVTPEELLSSSSRQLITAPPNISVKKALLILARENIPSLPIQSHNDTGKVVNIVNNFDILDYVVGFATGSDTPGQLQNRAERKLANSIEAVMTLDTDRESYRVYAVERNERLEGLIEAFASGRCHRALVLKGPNEPARIITQADVLEFIQHHPESAGVSLDGLASTYGLGTPRDVVSIQEDDSAIVGFAKLAEHGITSAPILDENKAIIGNLRAYDAREIAVTDFNILERPVMEFLKHTKAGVRKPVTVHEDVTLKEVMDKILEAKAHHAWVLGKDGHVISVISFSDLCKVFK